MFGAFRDAVVFQCNVSTRSRAAAPQSDNCLSFQLILQVTGRSFSAPQILKRDVQDQKKKKKKKRSILKNKMPPPSTAHFLSSPPCACPLPVGMGIHKRAPHSRASGSPAVASESGGLRCAFTLPLHRGSVRRAHDTAHPPLLPPPKPPTPRPPVHIRPQ